MATGERLQLVRQALGYSPADLAAAVGIEERKLLAFEGGDQEPEPEELWNLSQSLETDLGFFLRTLPVIDVAPVTPRLDKITDEQSAQVIAQTRLWLERYYDIESFFEMDEIPLPSMPDGFPFPVKSGRDAAEAADRLRIAWRIGINPIRSLSNLMEDMGIKVGLILGVDGWDSTAFETDDEVTLPLIMLNRTLPGYEQRFALMREVAYFFLDGANPQLASHFAASFLVPTDGLLKDMGKQRSNIELYELHSLKEKYGVSMRRLLTRAASLKIISGSDLEEWQDLFNELGWKDLEPGPAYPPEVSHRMMQLVLRLQAEGEVSEERAAEMLGVPYDWWDDLLHFRLTSPIPPEPGIEEEEEETPAPAAAAAPEPKAEAKPVEAEKAPEPAPEPEPAKAEAEAPAAEPADEKSKAETTE